MNSTTTASKSILAMSNSIRASDDVGSVVRLEPGPTDVLCQRGRKALTHIGNKRYRSILESHTEEYSQAKTKLEKSLIVTKIIDQVRQATPPGAFIRESEDTGAWQDVGDTVAREKIGQGFRDLLHTQYRSSTKAKKRRRNENIEGLRQRSGVRGRVDSGLSLKKRNAFSASTSSSSSTLADSVTSSNLSDSITSSSLSDSVTSLASSKIDSINDDGIENTQFHEIDEKLIHSKRNSLFFPGDFSGVAEEEFMKPIEPLSFDEDADMMPPTKKRSIVVAKRSSPVRSSIRHSVRKSIRNSVRCSIRLSMLDFGPLKEEDLFDDIDPVDVDVALGNAPSRRRHAVAPRPALSGSVFDQMPVVSRPDHDLVRRMSLMQ